MREWHVGTCLAVPQGEKGQEISLCAPAPLLPLWEKGLGDEGLSMLSLKFLSRFELIPTNRFVITFDGPRLTFTTAD